MGSGEACEDLAFMPRTTERLRSAVERGRNSIPKAEYESFLADIKAVFTKYTQKLSESAPGIDRGAALHRMMDQALEPAKDAKVRCFRGCSGCCHYEVEITGDEAAVLASCVAQGIEIDGDRLAAQASRQRRGKEWGKVMDPSNRCVFLDKDGSCRVYSDRPMACRRNLVTSPAIACSIPGLAVAPVEILLVEILVSAAISLPGTRWDSLSKMLRLSLQEGASSHASAP